MVMVDIEDMDMADTTEAVDMEDLVDTMAAAVVVVDSALADPRPELTLSRRASTKVDSVVSEEVALPQVPTLELSHLITVVVSEDSVEAELLPELMPKASHSTREAVDSEDSVA